MTEAATWPSPSSAMTPVPYGCAAGSPRNRDSTTLCLEPVGELLPAPQTREFMMLYAFGVGRGCDLRQRRPDHKRRNRHPHNPHGWRGEPGTARRAPGHGKWDARTARHELGSCRCRRPRLGHRRRRGRPRTTSARGARCAGRPRPLRPGGADRGARSRDDFLFSEELQDWARGGSIEVHVTVDVPVQGWPGEVGFVIESLRRLPLRPDGTTAFLCGPELSTEPSHPAVVGPISPGSG